MKLPRGDLTVSRVVDDHGVALADALVDALTGYLIVEPGATLLTDADGVGVLTFADGVPVLASHTDTGRGGSRALADLAGPGPIQVDRHTVDADALAAVHDADGVDALAVAPGEPARVLANDHALAADARDAAPDDHPGRADATDPLEAFLADEDAVAAVREEARAEAARRADEWGFADELE